MYLPTSFSSSTCPANMISVSWTLTLAFLSTFTVIWWVGAPGGTGGPASAGGPGVAYGRSLFSSLLKAIIGVAKNTFKSGIVEYYEYYLLPKGYTNFL